MNHVGDRYTFGMKCVMLLGSEKMLVESSKGYKHESTPLIMNDLADFTRRTQCKLYLPHIIYRNSMDTTNVQLGQDSMKAAAGNLKRGIFSLRPPKRVRNQV